MAECYKKRTPTAKFCKRFPARQRLRGFTAGKAYDWSRSFERGARRMKAIVLGKAERQILVGVPVLFLAGTLIHFLYGLSGEFFLVGLLAPVNESVWEHLKLALWPTTLWWTAGYLWAQRRGRELDAPAWFAAALGALLTTEITIVLLFLE